MTETRFLYRASDEPGYFGQGSCWSETEQDAAAYRDNPGFGGASLYRATVKVDPDQVLDLTGSDPFAALAAAVEPDDSESQLDRIEGWRADHAYVWEAWEDGDVEVADLLAAGYRWVRYLDNYPDGAVTWLRVAEEPLHPVQIA